MLAKTELLTTEELNSLKKELRSNYFIGVTFFLMVYMLIHIFFYANTEQWIIPRFELFIALGVLFTILLLTFILSRPLRNEIDAGTKIIEYKTIENKYSYVDRQDKFSKEFTKYLIIASGNKFTVTEELFIKADVSDYLLVHKTTEREIELKLEIEKYLPTNTPVSTD